MSASRMPWEIPADVQSHEWIRPTAGESERCKHCDALRLYVAFFGGACNQAGSTGTGNQPNRRSER